MARRRSITEQTAGAAAGTEPETPAEAQPASALPQPVRAAVGDVLHVYCPTLFQGPRPGVVVSAFASTGRVNIQVLLDQVVDAQASHEFRSRPFGNTLELVPVYEPLDERQRTDLERAIRQGGDVRPCWAEPRSRLDRTSVS